VPVTFGQSRDVGADAGLNTLVVDPLGNSTFHTISDAIKHAEPGTRILVRPGLYREALLIDKHMEIIGDGNREDTVVEGVGYYAVRFTAPEGRVSNLTLRCTGKLYGAVSIAKGTLVLENCDIAFSRIGIVVEARAKAHIRVNRIYNSAIGILVSDKSEGRIEENEIFRNDCGIDLRAGTTSNVRRNRIHDNVGQGILIRDDATGALDENDIVSNGKSGVDVRGGLVTARGNRILRNRVGVMVHKGGGGEFVSNELNLNSESAWDIEKECETNVNRR
jgi:F-box protein 11